MGLANIVIQRTEIVYGAGSFTVRGITVNDITKIMVDGHREDLEQAVEQLELAIGGNLEDATTSNVVGAMALLIQELPTLAAKLIACCADEYEMWPTAIQLPLPVQLDAVMEVGKLTFAGEADVKKFMTLLIDFITATRRAAKPMVTAATEKLGGMKA